VFSSRGFRRIGMGNEGVVQLQRVLVTGGAGFIGSHLVRALLDTGLYSVRVLDNFATGHRENLSEVSGSIEVVEGDIRDLETVEEAVDGCWAILHQAALPSVPRSIKAPVTSNDVNTGGTLKLLSAAHKAGVQKLVMASSSSVYGDSPILPKSEDFAPDPLSPYAVSKLAAEYYCKAFHRIYGMETMSLRYFNVFGPRQDPNSQYSGVVARLIDCALYGGSFTLQGDGTQARDFTYVQNVVNANLLALTCGALRGQSINIACGSRVSLLTLIQSLRDQTGSEFEVANGPARVGDVPVSQADISLARATLGYAPTVSFESGLAKTLEWRREQDSPRV